MTLPNTTSGNLSPLLSDHLQKGKKKLIKIYQVNIVQYLYECHRVGIVSSFLDNIKPFYCFKYGFNSKPWQNYEEKEQIQELSDINSRFVNDINVKLVDFSEKMNYFISKYKKVCLELPQCKSFNSLLLSRIIQILLQMSQILRTVV